MKDKCRPPSKFFFLVVAFLTIPILTMGQNVTGGATRLRILVPVRKFTDFVWAEKNNLTEEYTYGGFAIEVFRAVMNKAFGPTVSLNFFGFENNNGTMNGTFDDMLGNLSSSNYQGAVGPISIMYYRLQLADFTRPYLDTSISMLVRLKNPPNKGRKIPLGTVTKYVVASSLAFSFIVALLFWFLEYRNDKHTSQPKIANSSPKQSSRNDDDLWRREVLGSMIQTRLVMIIFFMVLIVLIACYTASQTTSLEGRRPSRDFEDLDQLRSNGANIGYREGSFIRDFLIQKGIDGSKLITLYNDEEVVSKLSKGTSQGGIDAIVADTPNLKILVAKHCDKFTIATNFNLPAAGFGFAFYKGFDNLSVVSDGILRIIEDGTLNEIQKRTIGSLDGCQDDPNASVYLDSDTLWILVAGAIAVFLLITIVMLLYCGTRCNTRTKKAVAYPCYLSPCC